jgi:hypothetical protein
LNPTATKEFLNWCKTHQTQLLTEQFCWMFSGAV